MLRNLRVVLDGFLAFLLLPPSVSTCLTGLLLLKFMGMLPEHSMFRINVT